MKLVSNDNISTDKIENIKALRTILKNTLKEAKNIIDHLQASGEWETPPNYPYIDVIKSNKIPLYDMGISVSPYLSPDQNELKKTIIKYVEKDEHWKAREVLDCLIKLTAFEDKE